MAAEGFRAAVRVGRAHQDMTQAGLADEMGICPTILSKLLKDPDRLTVDRLRGMIRAIDLDPLAVLALLGYDEKAVKNLTRNNGQNN